MTHWSCLPRACMSLCLCVSVFRGTCHRCKWRSNVDFRKSSIALHPNLNCKVVFIYFCTCMYKSVLAYACIPLCVGVHVPMEDWGRCQICWGHSNRWLWAAQCESWEANSARTKILNSLAISLVPSPHLNFWNRVSHWTWSLLVHPDWPASPHPLILLSAFSIAGVIVSWAQWCPTFTWVPRIPIQILTGVL